MKTFVIAVENSPNIPVFTEAFNSFNDKFEVFDAITPDKGYNDNLHLVDRIHKGFEKARYANAPKRPRIECCFISHYKLMEIGVKLNEPILIVEEDAIPIKKMDYDLFNHYLSSVDVLKFETFETTGAYAITPRGCAKVIEEHMNHGWYAIDIFQHRMVDRKFNLTRHILVDGFFDLNLDKGRGTYIGNGNWDK